MLFKYLSSQYTFEKKKLNFYGTGLPVFSLRFLLLEIDAFDVSFILYSGYVAQWLRCSATNRKVAGSIPAVVIGFFIDIKYFRSHYGSEVESASNRNEYHEYFLGVKAAGA